MADRAMHAARLLDDPFLDPYREQIASRHERAIAMERRLTGDAQSLDAFAGGHEFFGLHRDAGEWVFREWAPNATALTLVGPFSDWREADRFRLRRVTDGGTWEIRLPPDALEHAMLYRLRVQWPGGSGDRIPAYARRVVQDDTTKIFNAQVWVPPTPYSWRREAASPAPDAPLFIYEAHVGMAQEREGVGTYTEFRDRILPRIAEGGYTAVQLMAVMEHPYYASFGYQVSSFFAASSRFGTPEELKSLVDTAHELGLRVIMDLVHSHAAPNEVEGLARFDGTRYQYFHSGSRGAHPAWGSYCFDYGKPEVLHFLLSNCRFWLDAYRVDGFRFDGITSMLYHHRGLGPAFTSYAHYFDESVDEDAITYLTLANRLVHTVKPSALTIAEDVSGMPGLAAPYEDGGCGFNCRLAMGVPDCWFKLINDVRDEDWNMSFLWHELTNRRADEQTVSYAECHDQALVGGKTIIFELADAAMYDAMRTSDRSLSVDRAVALHKMIRLATLSTAGHGYLNFMGNEFGHPEWIDFPREGNGWSYHHARRQWRLRDDPDLQYHFLADFDRAMLDLARHAGIPGPTPPRLAQLQDDKKILVFQRGDLWFLFNFHPKQSLTDHEIVALPGTYDLVLDTDEPRFGGQGRLTPGQHYVTLSEVTGKARNDVLRVYLPCRVAAVLRRRPGGHS